MKMKYVKPQFAVESFNMTQSIAIDCNWERHEINPDKGRPNHWDKNSCGWMEDGIVFWLDAATKCTKIVGSDFEIVDGCYNSPNGNYGIFASN